MVSVLAVALVGCGGRSDSSGTALQWKRCADGWECTMLRVPVDYREPGGPTVALAVTRHRATEPAQRIGPLFVNPGGPGESAVSFAQSSLSVLPSPVRERFDIVAFDPRGVGKSAPINCNANVDDLFRGLDISPDTAQERQALEAASDRFARACASGPSATLLGHVDTATIARDMDSVRVALGAPQLSYVGFSWGTYLGAWYAELFPRTVRAMVLDGAVDPARTTEQSVNEQAEGFDASLRAFLADCAAASSCAFSNGGDPAGAFNRLAAAIDRQPVPAGDEVVGPSEFEIAVAAYLYGGRAAWPALATALTRAQAGDASQLRQAYAEYVGLQPSGDNGSYESYVALTCGDVPRVGDVSAYEAAAQRAAAAAPVFGPSTAYLGLPCATWPVDGPNPPRALRAAGAPPIVVIGTAGDPATPLDWATALASELESGVLVTSNGTSHTAIGRSDCVDRAVEGYLISLTVPKGLACTDA